MIQFVAAIGLLRHPENIEQLWLASWNSQQQQQQQYEFVFAERLEGESYRECLDREVSSVLRLRRGKDYIISSVPRVHLDDVLSITPGEPEIRFVVEFYVIDLYGGSARVTVDNNPATRWLSVSELLRGVTADGRRVDPVLVALLKRADVLTQIAD